MKKTVASHLSFVTSIVEQRYVKKVELQRLPVLPITVPELVEGRSLNLSTC